MTKIKLLLFSIGTILFSYSTASGGLGDYTSSFKPTKISIYGHTGQDPVSKSTRGKDDFFIPTKVNPKLDVTAILDLPTSIVGLMAIDIDIDIDVSSISVNQESIFSVPNTPVPYITGMNDSDSSSIHSGISGGTVPAPPAFLLLMSGLFNRSRRKS